MEKNYLYGYLFSYNPFNETWNVFKSEDKEKYFNEGKSEYSAKDINHILEVLSANNNKPIPEAKIVDARKFKE